MTDQTATTTPWTAMASLIEERGWTQGAMETPDGVCVTAACRAALEDQPGEWLIVRGVMRARDRAEDWNDSEETTREDVMDWLRTADPITEEELGEVYGPQWREVCAVVRRAATLTAAEAQAVNRKLPVVPGEACYVASGAGRAAARVAAAISVRDLIPREHYWALARPWVSVIGPIHTEDPPVEEWTS